MFKKEKDNKFKELREKAERKVSQDKESVQINDKKEILKTIHELHVHQIELEMQSEELINSQNELEKSRNKYSDLFDFAPIGYFILDNKGNISEANLTGASMLGIDRSQLITKPFALYIDNEDKDIFYVNRRNVLNNTICNVRLDLKLIHKDKSSFYAEIIMEPITTSDNKITYCHVAVIDISERKKTQEELHQSEKKYRSLFNTMSEGLALHEIICDEMGRPCNYRFLDINPAFIRQTGLKASDIIGKTVKEVIPDIEQFWIDTYGQVALTGKSKKFEHFSKSLNRYYEVFAYQTQPMQFAAIFMDITVRKQAEKALAESEKQYRELVETANSIIMRWDNKGIIRFINTFGAKFFGYSDDELLNRDVMNILPKVESGTGRDLEALAKDIILHPEQHTQVLNENIRKNGESVWVAWTNKAILDEHGNVLEILAIGNDITEIKQTEEKLRKSQKELEQFNSTMVHRELRMIELKKEINELCLQAGLPKRYNIDFTDEQQKQASKHG